MVAVVPLCCDKAVSLVRFVVFEVDLDMGVLP